MFLKQDYSKKNISPLKVKHIAMDMISSWLSLPSLKRNGKYRQLEPPHILRIKDDLRKSPPRYASKEVKLDWDSMFYNFEGFDIQRTRIFNS